MNAESQRQLSFKRLHQLNVIYKKTGSSAKFRSIGGYKWN